MVPKRLAQLARSQSPRTRWHLFRPVSCKRQIQTSLTILFNITIVKTKSQPLISEVQTEFRSVYATRWQLCRKQSTKVVVGAVIKILSSETGTYFLPYTVGQAIAAFHQEPLIAYNQKSEIWISDQIYGRIFNDKTTGAHLAFCYSLLRAVEDAKRSIVAQSKGDDGLTGQERQRLSYFRHRGSTYLLTSAIASCMETFLQRRIVEPAKISFGQRVSPAAAT